MRPATAHTSRDSGRRAIARRCGLAPRSAGSVSTARRKRSRRSRAAGSAQRRAKSGIDAATPSTATTSTSSKPATPDLFGELGRVVEIGGREVARIAGVVAVLARGEIARDDRREDGVVEERAAKAVDEGRVARDRRGEQPASRTQHAKRLAQRPHAVRSLGQVVERPEQQHRVGGRVAERQGTRVSDLRAREPSLLARRRGGPRRIDVERHRIHEVRLVARLGQPERISPGGAADVEDDAAAASGDAGGSAPVSARARAGSSPPRAGPAPARARRRRAPRPGGALRSSGSPAPPQPSLRSSFGGRYQRSAPPSASWPGTSTSAAPPFLKVRR